MHSYLKQILRASNAKYQFPQHNVVMPQSRNFPSIILLMTQSCKMVIYGAISSKLVHQHSRHFERKEHVIWHSVTSGESVSYIQIWRTYFSYRQIVFVKYISDFFFFFQCCKYSTNIQLEKTRNMIIYFTDFGDIKLERLVQFLDTHYTSGVLIRKPIKSFEEK